MVKKEGVPPILAKEPQLRRVEVQQEHAQKSFVCTC